MASRLPCNWQTTRLEFETVSLDDFASAEALDEIAFLKIDAEGMEVDVIQGGQGVLSKAQRVVLETHSLPLHQQTIDLLQRVPLRIDSGRFDGGTGLVFASRQSDGSNQK
jgi:hypothetical protein